MGSGNGLLTIRTFWKRICIHETRSVFANGAGMNSREGLQCDGENHCTEITAGKKPARRLFC